MGPLRRFLLRPIAWLARPAVAAIDRAYARGFNTPGDVLNPYWPHAPLRAWAWSVGHNVGPLILAARTAVQVANKARPLAPPSTPFAVQRTEQPSGRPVAVKIFSRTNACRSTCLHAGNKN